jgi:Xaa-Pro dipeptidase
MARTASASSALNKAGTATTPRPPGAGGEGRLSELRAWMAQQGLEAAYITRPVSIAYLTGFQADPHERLMALAVRPDHATLIVPALERDHAVSSTDQATVVGWRDGEDPYDLVCDAIEDCARLGVEKEHLTVQAAEALRTRAGAGKFVDVAGEVRRLRRTKSPEELKKLERACVITDRVTEQVMDQLRAGQSELGVAVIVGAAIAELGAVPSFETLVQSGPNSAVPHNRPSARKLEGGDLVLLDFGAAFEGFRADTTRMAVVGEPSARQLEIHDLVLRAHDAAIAAVRPGVTTGDVDAAARKVITAAGLGDRFFHRVGHGLGLEAHEDPSLDPGSNLVLEPGMVFTIEPGIYIPLWGGVRIEDDVVVEAGGCRVLTRAGHDLRVVPAR